MRRVVHAIAALAIGPFAGIRELIKDLHYRNDAERELARLEVVDRQLEIAARYGLLEDPSLRAECARRLLGRSGDAVEQPRELPPP